MNPDKPASREQPPIVLAESAAEGATLDAAGPHVSGEGIRDHRYQLGQWYWLLDSRHGEWLACVMHIGSNFIELNGPHHPHRGYRVARVHITEAHERLRFEPNAGTVIQGKIAEHQRQSQRLLAEVKALTSRLGVSPAIALAQHGPADGGDGRALAVLSDQTDVKAYERALVKAKKTELPELFNAIKDEQEEAARWMTAETLPMQAQANQLKGSLDEIEGRIFNVSLYAGLTEQIEVCADGAPAPMGSKLHVMQRRLYMDEECLLNYRSGGMEFSDITEFDRWLVVPENRDRILPFPRCMVAMRVRRKAKGRDSDGTTLSAFINMRLAQADTLTFLYIRNGERVSRLSCEQDFGELIFPEKAVYAPSEPLMVKMWGGGRVDKIITRREYDDRVRASEAWDAQYAQWKQAHPYEQWCEDQRTALIREYHEKDEHYKARHPLATWVERRVERDITSWAYEFANPYRPDRQPYADRINPREWEPFDDTSVNYDAVAKKISDEIKEYNRIALIIQGLFDRSTVLHPHAPVRTWDPASFAENIELVYDGSALLSYGDAPDIEDYIVRCNASLREGCVTVGQEDFWERKEAEKECARRDRDYRDQSGARPERYRPYGNPGPGYVARIAKFRPKARQALFIWNRERLTDSRSLFGPQSGDPIRTTLTVPADALLNCDAYRLGDYKQFFRDPRTRAEYLRWAPLLLAAEEYQRGQIEVREPVG